MSEFGSQIAPVYLKIRGDHNAGIIRAFYAMQDGSAETLIATISMKICDEDPEVYKEWKTAMFNIHKRWIERIAGVKAIGHTEIKRHSQN